MSASPRCENDLAVYSEDIIIFKLTREIVFQTQRRQRTKSSKTVVKHRKPDTNPGWKKKKVWLAATYTKHFGWKVPPKFPIVLWKLLIGNFYKTIFLDMRPHDLYFSHKVFWRRKQSKKILLLFSGKTSLDVNVMELDSALRWFPLHKSADEQVGDSAANFQVKNIN